MIKSYRAKKKSYKLINHENYVTLLLIRNFIIQLKNTKIYLLILQSYIHQALHE